MHFVKFYLISQSFFLIPNAVVSTSIDSKCIPTYGGCTRLDNDDENDGLIIQEITRCKPIRKNTTIENRQICLHINNTGVIFDLESGLVEQATFFEVTHLIRIYCLSKIDIYMAHVKGFNAESPLMIDSSCNQIIEFNFGLDVLPFEFIDNNRKRLRTCDDFERLNNSGYFFNFPNSYNQKIKNFDVNYVRFGSDPICEIVFLNMQIDTLNINYLIQTFFKTSILKLTKLSNKARLNARVENLNIKGFNADLTDSLLSVNVSMNKSKR